MHNIPVFYVLIMATSLRIEHMCKMLKKIINKNWFVSYIGLMHAKFWLPYHICLQLTSLSWSSVQKLISGWNFHVYTIYPNYWAFTNLFAVSGMFHHVFFKLCHVFELVILCFQWSYLFKKLSLSQTHI